MQVTLEPQVLLHEQLGDGNVAQLTAEPLRLGWAVDGLKLAETSVGFEPARRGDEVVPAGTEDIPRKCELIKNGLWVGTRSVLDLDNHAGLKCSGAVRGERDHV